MQRFQRFRAFTRMGSAWLGVAARVGLGLGLVGFAMFLDTNANFNFNVIARANPAANAAAFTTTRHDVYRDRAAFYRRMLVAGYERHGRRDRRWDDAAFMAFEAWAMRWGYEEGTPMFSRAAGVPARDAVVASLTEALDAGSDDALVRMAGLLFGVNGTDELDEAAAREHALRTHRALRDSEHAPLVKYVAAKAALRRLDTADAAHPAVQRDAASALIRIATYDAYLPSERRAVLAYVWNDLDGRPEAARASLWRRIEAEHARTPGDAWIVDTLAGLHFSALAWDWYNRDGNWRQDADSPGYRAFYTNLDAARLRLERAHALAPGFPEAATAMIRLEKAFRGDDALARCRRWFDAAVAAQVDAMDAWNEMHRAMIPHWGGTPQMQWDLAQEALAIGRFDTDVTRRFRHTLVKIDKRLGWRDVWDRPETWAGLQRQFEGMLAEPVRAGELDYLRVSYAAAAFRCGAFVFAREQLRASGVPFEALTTERRWLRAWELYEIDRPARAMSEAFARGGPAFPLIDGAERYGNEDGKWELAFGVLTKALREMAADDPGRAFVAQMRFAMRVMADDAAGVATDLLAADWRRCWEVKSGDWSWEMGDESGDGGGALVGRSVKRDYDQGLILASRYEFLSRGVLTGRMTVEPLRVDASDGAARQAVNAAWLLHLTSAAGWEHFHGVQVYPGDSPGDVAAVREAGAAVLPVPGRVGVGKYWPHGDELRDAKIPEAFEFELGWWDGRVMLRIDGGLFLLDAPLPDPPDTGLARIGLGAQAGDVGQTLRISKLAYRPLFDRPEWLIGD
ncbi:MAG: hypothetical protein AAF328_07195 [Planctomycetota bacterium]